MSDDSTSSYDPSESLAIRRAIRALFGIVLLTNLAKITINPVLAPLARATNLEAWHVGAMVSASALMITLTSTWWGRRSLKWGYRRVLRLSIWVNLFALVSFWLAAEAGMARILGGTLLFLLFLLSRGIIYGWALAAISPTTQAYVAAITTTESQRVKGMASMGAAQSLSMIGGAMLGALLGILGLRAPLIGAPFLVLAAVFLLLFLPHPDHNQLVKNPPKMSPWDKRVLPYLITGYAMFTAVGMTQIIMGFIVADRFHLDPQQTITITGLGLLASGIGSLTAQLGIIPRISWHPHRLLKVGIAILTVAAIILVFHLPMWTIFVSMFLLGLGSGFAVPGYTAAPTMLVNDEEQGALAGLLWGNNAFAFMITPVAAGALYTLHHDIPTVAGAVMMLGALLLALLHPHLRRG
ncbi:MFS transporter [Boudabousia marimammalium]|uniref:Major facilitator superfamily (MFS) profile domain-containing protein n=1 Tax=Boudabousia marimammalium TaxID=156892 RepID=A0A1Q5PSP1_9ACTO|nr:MFS transporter [Boudabousia marimammalium]OKL50604.1 hypothetical protein BM477_01205 [Boudabousia marimammalium]